MGGDGYTQNFIVNGALNLAGTASQRVVLTNDTVPASAVYRDGIEFMKGSTGTLNYATLEELNNNFACPGCDGSFTTPATIPTNATAGTYPIAAIGKTSSAFVKVPFTVTP